MENSVKIEKLFQYTDLSEWTDVVPASVHSFYLEFSMYPNVLYANSELFNKLLKICIAEGIENIHPTDQEPLILGGYISHEYALEYVPDDLIPEYRFLLVFDPIITVKKSHHE